MATCLAVVKRRLDVDDDSRRVLDDQSRKCNWLYNKLLELANELRTQYRATPTEEVARTLYTKRGLRNQVPTLKKSHPFLKTVHSSPLKNSALRLTESIQTFQKSRRSDGPPRGWPRFRSWKAAWFSLFYDEPDKGWKLDGSTLRLSLGVGQEGKRRVLELRVRAIRALKGTTPRNVRIVCEAGVYSAVFTVARTIPEPRRVKTRAETASALDPNHKNLAYGVDTEGRAIEIEAPWWLKAYDKRLDELKALRDRCRRKARQVPVLDDNGAPTGKQRWEPSRRWKKRDAAYRRALAKRRDQTKTFLYTVANRLMRSYDLVGIGDYTPHGGGISTPMRRAMNNRSLIGRFKSTLSWCASKSGKIYDEYQEGGTTRTCSGCGYQAAGGIPPEKRKWRCPVCARDHIRDENAAVNGLERVLERYQEKCGGMPPSVPGSGLVSVRERWVWRVRPSGIACEPAGEGLRFDRMRQEIKSGT